MQIKKVLIKHILRKGFLGKGLEHYLRNRLRSVFLAVPKIDHGKVRSHKISQNIMDYRVPRFCEIFCEILISQKNKMCFWKIYFENILRKYLFEKDCIKILFKLLKISCWKRIFGWDFWKDFMKHKPCTIWKKECFIQILFS